MSRCCRKGKIYSVKVDHVKKQGELFEVVVPDTKNKVPRKFIIDSRFVPLVEKYQALRPSKAKRDNFLYSILKASAATK